MIYEPIKLEPEILKFWDKNKIFKKLQKKLANSKKRFSFLDGPITANNPMGVHHAWGRTYKDVFQRYKAMQGYNQRWQNGFDCQGLWVEREVEKELGFKSKEDIEKFGLDKWAKACRARVLKFSKQITEDSIRLGQWMNWGDDYFTMSDNNQLHNWHLLKKYYEKGWLYKGKDVVPWCPRCGTASSKHDILTEGYKEVTHTALYMQFPIKGKKDEYLLVWTTTPWTIPADVAVAVNPNIYYVKVKQKNKFYWLAESRLEVLDGKYEVVDKLIGSDLAGITYDMPYSNLPAQKKAKSPFKVVVWNLVSDEEGTGLVHIAPGCGPEDYDLGQKERLPALSPLDEAGIYLDGYGWLSGMAAKDANPKVIEDLEKRGFVYKTEKYTHRYPHCWRCHTELVFRLVPEWYIKADEIRPQLIAANKKTIWYPEYGKRRQEDWFNNMGDWMISQKRFWGLPLPIWECECGHIEVIGSLEELKKKAVKGIPQLKEIHRPWIDKVILKCPKCGKEIKRIPDIGITWLDAGIVPFSTIGPYLKNKKYWKTWFPADLICENYPGQYRGWFNAIYWSSVTLAKQAPFKAILGYETLKDDKGREMHKSLGNAIWAKEALAKLGADPLRLRFCLQDPSRELWFGWKSCDDAKKFLNILWNLHQLILKSGKINTKLPTKLQTEDKWILSKLNSLIETCTKSLNMYHPYEAAYALKEFWMNDLSRSYVHFIRDRLAERDSVALSVLYNIYIQLLKLLAPIIPFITEAIWQNFRKEFKLKEESIHLCDWPVADKKLINKKLEEQINIVKDIVSNVLSIREKKMNRPVKWPVKKVIIVTKDKNVSSAVKKHKELIKSLTNALEVEVQEKLKGIKYKVKADYAKLGPKYGKDSAIVIMRIAEQSPESVIKKLKEKGEFKVEIRAGTTATIVADDLKIEEIIPENLAGMENIYIEKEETPEMLKAGFTREVIRKIQALRKKAGLSKLDKISLSISTNVDLNLNEIKEKVGAKDIKINSIKGKKFTDKFKVRNKEIAIGFNVL